MICACTRVEMAWKMVGFCDRVSRISPVQPEMEGALPFATERMVVRRCESEMRVSGHGGSRGRGVWLVLGGCLLRRVARNCGVSGQKSLLRSACTALLACPERSLRQALRILEVVGREG